MSRPQVPRLDVGTGDIFYVRLTGGAVLLKGNGERAGRMPALQRKKRRVKGAGRRPAVRTSKAKGAGERRRRYKLLRLRRSGRRVGRWRWMRRWWGGWIRRRLCIRLRLLVRRWRWLRLLRLRRWAQRYVDAALGVGVYCALHVELVEGDGIFAAVVGDVVELVVGDPVVGDGVDGAVFQE